MAHGLCSNAEAQAGIDGDVETPFLQPVGLDPRRLAELDHVGEQRLAHFAADALQLGLALGRFDEDHVGAGLLVELRAAQRLVEPVRGARIGARHDHGLGMPPRLGGDLIFITISSAGTTRRPGVWPHFLGISWSSIWIAATPAAS